MKIALQIEGAAELKQQLATLADRVQKKVIRQAVRNAQKAVMAAEKTSARGMIGGEMGGKIADALQIRVPLKGQKKNEYSLHVTLRADEAFIGPGKRSGRKTYIPAAIEYGHTTGRTYVPPIPALRTATQTVAEQVLRKFSDELRMGLLREAIVGRNR